MIFTYFKKTLFQLLLAPIVSCATNLGEEANVLHKYLYDLLDNYNDKKIPKAELENKIKETINKFIK